jgi:hypothetical protein
MRSRLLEIENREDVSSLRAARGSAVFDRLTGSHGEVVRPVNTNSS